MKAALLRNTLVLALLLYALADWHAWHGPFRRWIEAMMRHEPPEESMDTPAIARVGKLKVTPFDLREALRDHLWRRGLAWNDLSPQEEDEVRTEVLQNLIDARLVALARADAAAAPTGAVDRELTQLRRQFDQDNDFDQRLALRQVSEKQLRQSVSDAIANQNWIETQIAVRVKAVTDAEGADWIQRHSASVAIPAVFSVAHIYLTTHDAKKPDREPEIREIARRLKSGEAPFEQLAAECSDDDRTKAIGGYLGWITRSRMPDDLMDVVEKMTKGQTSEPVRTKLGWHVIRLIDLKPHRAAVETEVKSEVAALLTNERRTQAVNGLMAELRDKFQQQITIDRSLLDGLEPAGEP